MSEYTAEDFAQAEFARHSDGRKAMRIGSDHGIFRWWVGKYGAATDEDMARDSWEPVMESGVTGRMLEAAESNAARKRQRLVDHIADQDRVIRRRNDEIAVLRAELRGAQAPLSLDALEAAWAAAEVPTDEAPIRAGDVIIAPNMEGTGYITRRAKSRDWEFREYRILSRAPRREPWQDLADAMEAGIPWIDRYNAVQAAQSLHERGVRVTGGDDNE